MARWRFWWIVLVLLLTAVSSVHALSSDTDSAFLKDYFPSTSLRHQYDRTDEHGKMAILKDALSKAWKQPHSDFVIRHKGLVEVENSGVTIRKGTFKEHDLLGLSESTRFELYTETEKLCLTEWFAQGFFKERLPVFKFWWANAKSLGKERQFIDAVKKAMIASGSNDDLVACLMIVVPLTLEDYADITKTMLVHIDTEEKYFQGQSGPIPVQGIILGSTRTSEIPYSDLLHNVVSKKLFPDEEMTKLAKRLCEILPTIRTTYSEPIMKDVGPFVAVAGSQDYTGHIYVPEPTGQYSEHKNPAWNNLKAILRNIPKYYPSLKSLIEQASANTSEKPATK